MNQKMMLRQFIFHAHKGLKRIYMFAIGGADYSFGMLPESFYKALDANKGLLSPDVRAAIPPVFTGFGWLSKLMDGGQPLDAPRPLSVSDLIEYKPRLVFAGDGTAANPNRWNRDEFAFLPFQLSASKYVIPYYVATLDVTHSWDTKKDLLDPARYDMPEQQFDVAIDNIGGKGAQVSGYDPLTNQPVPVSVVSSGPHSMTVRLQSTDYPRVLTVTEAAPGPQILQPKISAGASGKVTLSWSTNIPVKARVTYGQDWTKRADNEMDIPGSKTQFAVALPGAWTGVVAARITVESPAGLIDVWPRWDEDPAGQVVVPGSKQAAPAGSPGASPTPTAAAVPAVTGQPVALTAPASVSLLRVAANLVHGFSLALPASVLLTGSPDAQQTAIGPASDPLTLRVLYLSGTPDPSGLLPAVSTIDTVSATAVSAPGFAKGVVYGYNLSAPAHPGMTNLRQRYLAIPTGNKGADLIVLAFEGTAAAFKQEESVIDAIEASVKVGG
jgi:hypothetical protein